MEEERKRLELELEMEMGIGGLRCPVPRAPAVSGLVPAAEALPLIGCIGTVTCPYRASANHGTRRHERRIRQSAIDWKKIGRSEMNTMRRTICRAWSDVGTYTHGIDRLYIAAESHERQPI